MTGGSIFLSPLHSLHDERRLKVIRREFIAPIQNRFSAQRRIAIVSVENRNMTGRIERMYGSKLGVCGNAEKALMFWRAKATKLKLLG